MSDVRVVPLDLYYVEHRLVADQAAEIERLSAVLAKAKELAGTVERYERDGRCPQPVVEACAAFRAAGG